MEQTKHQITRLSSLKNIKRPNLLLGIGLGFCFIVIAALGGFWFLEKSVKAPPLSIAQQNTQQNIYARLTHTQPHTQHNMQQESITKAPLFITKNLSQGTAALQTPIFTENTNQTHSPQQWDKVIDQIYEATPAPVKAVNIQPRYKTNAVPYQPFAPNAPKIAIVIDDVGVNVALSQQAEKNLPREVTFSYLPYGRATKDLVEVAKVKGREVMIHLPMEPQSRPEEPPINPGPNALYTHMDAAKIQENVHKNLMFLKDYAVGVNNHMGSRFTSSFEGMQTTLTEIQKEGLFFMDSLTTHKSAVKKAAAIVPKMPLLVRDIFLDHYQTEGALMEALHKLEEEAKENGTAIAIGHPHQITVKALLKWLPTLQEKGIALVPISALLPTEE